MSKVTDVEVSAFSECFLLTLNALFFPATKSFTMEELSICGLSLDPKGDRDFFEGFHIQIPTSKHESKILIYNYDADNLMDAGLFGIPQMQSNKDSFLYVLYISTNDEHVITPPPRFRGGVLFSLQRVCLSVCLSVCVCVCVCVRVYVYVYVRTCVHGCDV